MRIVYIERSELRDLLSSTTAECYVIRNGVMGKTETTRIDKRSACVRKLFNGLTRSCRNAQKTPSPARTTSSPSYQHCIFCALCLNSELLVARQPSTFPLALTFTRASSSSPPPQYNSLTAISVLPGFQLRIPLRDLTVEHRNKIGKLCRLVKEIVCPETDTHTTILIVREIRQHNRQRCP